MNSGTREMPKWEELDFSSFASFFDDFSKYMYQLPQQIAKIKADQKQDLDALSPRP